MNPCYTEWEYASDVAFDKTGERGGGEWTIIYQKSYEPFLDVCSLRNNTDVIILN